MSTPIPDPATTDWIPMGPPLSINPDLTYKGNWASATTYYEGDIVIYANMAYLCVKQSTSAPAIWPAAQMLPLLTSAQMTALVPNDGQVIRLQVDATNGIEWLLAYRAGSASPYKWEFIGGPDIWSYVDASEGSATTGAWMNLTTNGPQVLAPRAGDYLAMYGSRFSHSASGGSGYLASAVGDTTGSVPAAFAGVPTAAGVLTYGLRAIHLGVAAGAAIKARYYNNTVGTGTWLQRWQTVQPIRVS